MFKFQVYTIDNEWETICETSEKYLNDMTDVLLDKFKGRSLRVLNSDDSLLWSNIYK